MRRLSSYTRRKRAHGAQRGETLVEVLVVVALASILVVTVMGSIATGLRVTQTHRRLAAAELLAGNYSEAIAAVPYVTCAQPVDYETPAGLDMPTGYTIRVDQVQLWDDGSNPPTFSDVPAGCVTDSGMQQVDYTVIRGGEELLSRTIVKRFDGIYDDAFGAVPGDGVRCTVTASADTSLDEANSTTAAGSANTMDLTGGASGSRNHALLRFDLVPGSTPCNEGGFLPEDMQVRAAALRIYTWSVAGAPDCSTSCGQVLERVEESWNEASATWVGQPSLSTPGTTLFQHGSTATDSGPRYQIITGPSLTNDVAGFYSVPSYNFGWAIKSACSPTYAGRTCDPAARFRIRTREASEVSQRPVLSLVLAPAISTSSQIRNIAFGTCASVKDNEDDGAQLVALNCAGQGWQSWTYTSELEFRGTNSGRCVETGQSSAGGAPVMIYGCADNPPRSWQQWEVDGTRIRYRNDRTKCLAIANSNPLLGTELVIETCNGSAGQQWAVEPLAPMPPPAAAVRLRNVAGNNCADPHVNNSTDSISARMEVQGFPCMGPERTNQSWAYSATGRLVSSRDSALCLDGVRSSGEVTVDNCHSESNQQWSYEGGLLRNLDQGLCLQAGIDGGDMQWYKLVTCSASVPAQQWVIEPDTNPTTVQLVQLRNTEYGDCAEPYPNAGSSGNRIWTLPCDSSRDTQTFVRLSNNELRPVTSLNMCIDGNVSIGTELRVWTCNELNQNTNVATNHHQRFQLTSNGQLQNVGDTSKCVQGYGNAINTRIQSCNPLLTSKQWNVEAPGTGSSSLRQLRNVGTGSCIEQPGDRTILWPCSGEERTSQGVFVLSNNEIRRADDLGQCLVIHNGNNSSGARLRWYSCSTTSFDNQRWDQVPVVGQPGQFQLKTRLPAGRCIEGFLDTVELEMRDCATANVNQRWTFEEPTDTRAVRQIRNKYAGACLDLPSAVANNVQLMLFPCLGADRPLQAFLMLNNGQFRPMSDLSKCLNVNGGQSGRPLHIYTCNGDEPVPDSSTVAPGYQLRVKNTNPNLCEYFDITANQPLIGNCGSTDQNALDRQTWFFEPVGTAAVSVPLQYRSGPAATAWCLDVAGNTASTFTSGTSIQSFPCLGSSRPNQSFVSLSNGMIRSLTTPALCLDSGESNTSGLALRTCSTSSSNQRWVTANGRLQNIYDSNNELRNKCMQGGMDGETVTMSTCSSSSEQVLTGEAVGSTVRPNVFGRFRSPHNGGSCLDSASIPDSSNAPEMWTQACVSSRSDHQTFLRLNNGQFRARNDTTRCLDANNGSTGARVRIGACNTPVSSNAQQTWDVDTSGLRSNAVEGGQRRCVEMFGGGVYVTQQPCAGTSAQTWAFEVTQ